MDTAVVEFFAGLVPRVKFCHHLMDRVTDLEVHWLKSGNCLLYIYDVIPVNRFVREKKFMKKSSWLRSALEVVSQVIDLVLGEFPPVMSYFKA